MLELFKYLMHAFSVFKSEKKPNCINNIYSTIRPLLYLCRLVGIAPITLPYNDIMGLKTYYNLKTSKVGVVHTFVLMCILTTMTVLDTIFDLSKVGKFRLIYLCEYTMSTASTLVIMLCSIKKLRENTNIVLQKISVIDHYLLENRSKVYKLHEFYLLVQVLFVMFIFSTFGICGIWIWNKSHSLTGRLLISLCIFINDSVKFAFTILVVNNLSLIKHRFKILNTYFTPKTNRNYSSSYNSLRRKLYGVSELEDIKVISCTNLPVDGHEQHARLYHLTGKITVNIKMSDLGNLRVRTLRIIHGNLCDIISVFNSLFGFQLLIMVMETFIANITGLYRILHGNKDSYEGASQFVLLSGIWTLMNLAYILVISAMCSSTCNEGQRITVLLQKLMLVPSLQTNTLSEIQMFLQQVIQQKMKITAFDFFTLNYRMLGSYVGAITTYLLILLQYM